MAQDPPATASTQKPPEWRDVLAPELMAYYVGKHIAIIHKRVVCAADTYDEVLDQAKAAYPDEMPYFAYIPLPEEGEPGFAADQT